MKKLIISFFLEEQQIKCLDDLANDIQGFNRSDALRLILDFNQLLKNSGVTYNQMLQFLKDKKSLRVFQTK